MSTEDKINKAENILKMCALDPTITFREIASMVVSSINETIETDLNIIIDVCNTN